jgi:hypothetical protein
MIAMVVMSVILTPARLSNPCVNQQASSDRKPPQYPELLDHA